jgi:septal ring factor EnvC (AmiA/AmiB activator)
MMIKRLLGVIIIVTALIGLAVCVAVIVLAPPVIDRVANDLDDNLTTLNSTLDTVSETLQLAQVTSAQVVTGLQTAEASVLDTARAISQTHPLVSGTGEILTGDVANSIDAVQANIPQLAQLAGNVDRALTFLSKAQILGFNLGINYNPAVPLDKSITDIGKSFNGIPAKLRSLSSQIDTANSNLDAMATNLTLIGSNLHDINASLTQYQDLFTKYRANASTAKQRLQNLQTQLHDDLQAIKTGLLVFFVWLGLTQLAPLYIGFDLLTRPRAI